MAVGGFVALFLGGANPRDPLTPTLVSVALGLVALSASAWPARRAARVNLVTVLRVE